ncbi:MAG: hypothetical protein JSW52_02880 [Candidatus Coatesbacteria bacterium]|nr:MAG: hypothetical protein JSW52_02880 [Candidatus Coatesbacteria bacterium]
MDTGIKTFCVVSLFWIAVVDDSNCEHPSGPPDIGDVSDAIPDDGSTDVPIEPVLSWHMDGEMDDDEFTYDVYFGTGEDPPLVFENLNTNKYYPGTLDYKTTYSWKIVATDDYGRADESPLWSFTTYDGVIINESFESEFPPQGWAGESVWDLSDQSHTGESSARGMTTTVSNNANLFSPVLNGYKDSSGSLDISFYYKPESQDRIPMLEFYIGNHGAPAIYLFSGWVDTDDWTLAEYTIRRSDLADKFKLVFRTYHEEPVSENACVLIDDVLVKDSALE